MLRTDQRVKLEDEVSIRVELGVRRASATVTVVRNHISIVLSYRGETIVLVWILRGGGSTSLVVRPVALHQVCMIIIVRNFHYKIAL